jgi:hypothetical protein
MLPARSVTQQGEHTTGFGQRRDLID